MSSIASWMDFVILALSIIIFVSAMLTSRWLQYSRVQADTSDAGAVNDPSPPDTTSATHTATDKDTQ